MHSAHRWLPGHKRPHRVTALLNIDLGGARTEPWRGPGGRQQCRGAWQRQLLRQRQCATPDGFAAVTLPRCCDDACTASSRGVSSIYQTQDQCPSLASARAVGGGTPLGLGGFHPPLDDSEGAWTHFKPSPPITHTLHHRIRSSLSELDYRDCKVRRCLSWGRSHGHHCDHGE